ncbi:PAP2 superfamily protein [Fimicolochytrium jonesii]|uniref:PAP2 superfamily protein n=1 Tax=Fimicolochytrium jonesii TaxID=1396493 RepID=UPI0022FE52D1|nr:PAP2 superfamily protein [Fimicolochytrium jonesii]KAI8824433.1 PAP2 superfamily protein [Fimicolochytrium jonesii]
MAIPHFRSNRNPSAGTIPPSGNQPVYKDEPFTPRGYIRNYAADYIIMACMGALGLGIYMLRPAPNRLFPIYFQDGEVVYPEFAYPLEKNIIPIWLAAFLAFTIPTLFIILMQIRIRSFYDANAAIMGLLFSLITAAVFQVFLKWLIGGLRPHFYAVCKPSIPPALANAGQGFSGIMVDRSVCTGDEKEINDSLESFPSGHSTAAFAGFLYLSYYLNAKLKIFSNYRPAFWKLLLFYAPILAATLIAGSLTIDKYHHWYDVLGGAIIGSMVATGAYRFQYAALFDYRFNHIPLPKGGQNFFRYAPGASDGPLVRPATRKAGWGGEYGAPVAGAPSDAMFGGAGAAGVPHMAAAPQHGELNV